MSQALVMQYRRGGKRLQILVLPYEDKFNISGLIRIWDQHVTAADRGWRFFPALGISVTLALGETERYVADAGIEDALQSAWVSNGAVLELREYFEVDNSELMDLKMDRIPKSLFNRIAEEVDNWA